MKSIEFGLGEKETLPIKKNTSSVKRETSPIENLPPIIEEKDYKYKELESENNPFYKPEGADVVDPENYYNELGFEDKDRKIYNDPVYDSEPAEEIGELMEKFGLEEWELEDLMKKCEDYLKFGKSDKFRVDKSQAGQPLKSGKFSADKFKSYPPLKDKKETKKLALFYREYLAAKNEDGLPFNEEERKRVSESKLEELSLLHQELRHLNFGIAEINEKEKIDEVNKDNRGDRNLQLAYSSNPKVVLESKDQYLGRIKKVREKIYAIERIIEGEEEGSKKINKKKERSIEDKERNIADIEKEQKILKKNIEKEEWRAAPDFSPEELKFLKRSVDWLRNPKNPYPTFDGGKKENGKKEKLTLPQILESAQEYADYKKWPRGRFWEQDFKGRRQLTSMEKFYDKDKKVLKRIKYVYSSDNLPEGEYYFEINPDRSFINKNDPNFMVAPIRLMISRDNPKEFFKEYEENKNKKREMGRKKQQIA